MGLRTAMRRAPQEPRPGTVGAVPSGARRPRRRRRLVLGVGAGLVAVWLVGWYSPLTTVEHVVVSAPRGLSESQIRRASGIAANDHVPSVDAEQVRRTLLAAMPAVADVRVERSLPHTIRLVVTARKPFAVLPDGAAFDVIDAGGVEFDRVQSPGQLPLIVETDPTRQLQARGVLVSLPESLRKRVARITAASPDNVGLTMRDGAVVVWGSVEDAPLKAQVLAALLSTRAARYDVSAPLLPTTSGKVS